MQKVRSPELEPSNPGCRVCKEPSLDFSIKAVAKVPLTASRGGSTQCDGGGTHALKASIWLLAFRPSCRFSSTEISSLPFYILSLSIPFGFPTLSATYGIPVFPAGVLRVRTSPLSYLLPSGVDVYTLTHKGHRKCWLLTGQPGPPKTLFCFFLSPSHGSMLSDLGLKQTREPDDTPELTSCLWSISPNPCKGPVWQ